MPGIEPRLMTEKQRISFEDWASNIDPKTPYADRKVYHRIFAGVVLGDPVWESDLIAHIRALEQGLERIAKAAAVLDEERSGDLVQDILESLQYNEDKAKSKRIAELEAIITRLNAAMTSLGSNVKVDRPKEPTDE